MIETEGRARRSDLFLVFLLVSVYVTYIYLYIQSTYMSLI